MLSGTVGLVLLIACVNVANLLLARAMSRRREIAVRAALGGSRLRLIRQLLTECLVLAFCGTTLGSVAAWWGLPLLMRFSPPDLPRIDQIGVDLNALIFVAAVGALTGVVFGVAPALQIVSPGANDANAIKEGITVSGTFRRNRSRSGLVVAEVALSVVLLAGAALMIRTLREVQDLDHGFVPDDVLTFQISLPASRYPVDAAQYRPIQPGAAPAVLTKPAAFYVELTDRLKALPGVESAGAVTSLPLNPAGIDFDLPVIIEGKPRPRAGEEPQADFRIATTEYFRAMTIPLLRGRMFTEADGPARAAVAIVNEAMARQFFAGEDPVGQRLILYGRSREIVGVVGSVRHHGYTREPRPEMIVPMRQFTMSTMTVVLRSAVAPAALAASVKQEVRAMDASLPVTRVRPMSDYLGASVARLRFTALLLGAFACLALTLSVVGVYGVMAYAVSQRAREIGVRMALGATRGDVVRMVVGQGMALTFVGIAVGLAGAAAASRFIAGLLFGVGATDPVSFGAAAAGLGAASFAAIYIPARRATRIDPINALRGIS